MNQSDVAEKQKPLRAKYRSSPETAMVTDHARTSGTDPRDPFHSRVEPMDGCGVTVPVGVHAGVGGLHDAPTPGDILCAALAACQDSTIRMVADLLGVELEHLEVEVTADADLRGTLGMERDVPVGFQAIRCSVRMRAKEGTSPAILEKLKGSAEHCCVVQQTLRNPPPVRTTFSVD
ncbi:MAG: OsmC family protein [Gemmatimonadetes bacterium]|nr:OsmC family protein [Gemmatimonadota bacterium]